MVPDKQRHQVGEVDVGADDAGLLGAVEQAPGFGAQLADHAGQRRGDIHATTPTRSPGARLLGRVPELVAELTGTG